MSSSWKLRIRIALLAIAGTALAGIVLLNLMPQEKQLTRDIHDVSPVDSLQFRNEISNIPGPAIVFGNHVRDLENGDEIFPAMLSAIRGARKTICFETYIYWSGDVGRQFVDALSERSRSGVAVHVLVDWVGGMRMKNESIERLRKAGVAFEYFHPLHWYTMDRMNNRSHRKLLIVDGRIGFTGGVGIADAWQGNADRPDRWRDMHFQIEGPAVSQLQAVFEDNWITTEGKVLTGPDYYPIPAAAAAGNMATQVISSSPDGGSERMQLMYLLAIAAARSSIDLEAAYFVPSERVSKSLVEAMQRGVKIRIIVPGAHVDSEIVRSASQAQWGAMLEAGATIHQFQQSMFHSKMMIVDRYLTMVGSANFDERSFGLNDEANLNIYDSGFADRMTEIFDQDVAHSTAMTLQQWRDRPWSQRIMERIAALTSAQI